MDKIIHLTVELPCSPQTAFTYFTSGPKLERWLTVKADVEPKAGGKYELFWDPADPENDSTIGCRLLVVEEPHYLNFEWKGPRQFKRQMNFRRPLTNVSVIFTPSPAGTIVSLLHTGWGEGDDWDTPREFFEHAWRGAFEQLLKLVNESE